LTHEPNPVKAPIVQQQTQVHYSNPRHIVAFDFVFVLSFTILVSLGCGLLFGVLDAATFVAGVFVLFGLLSGLFSSLFIFLNFIIFCSFCFGLLIFGVLFLNRLAVLVLS
jgi:hypothetical protein